MPNPLFDPLFNPLYVDPLKRAFGGNLFGDLDYTEQPTYTEDELNNLPVTKPIKNNLEHYKIGKRKYNANPYMLDLYRQYDELNPVNYNDPNYIDEEPDLPNDPLELQQAIMQQKQDNAYNQANQSIINKAISNAPPGALTGTLPADAIPPIKLPNVTLEQAEQEALKNAKVNETTADPTYGEKWANGFFGKNFKGLSMGLDSIANIGAMFNRGQSTYNGPKGSIRAGIDTGWSAASNAAAKLGPYGLIVSAGMKGINALNNILGAIFGATNGMTTLDSIMDSPLGFLTGLGWANQAFGRKSDTITKNEEVLASLGNSYSGLNSGIDDALNYSGKKYGAFSSGARHDANALIADMRVKLNTATQMSDIATTRSNLVTGMSSIAGNNRSYNMQGGYNQGAIHVGRQGMKIIQRAKDILYNSNVKKVPDIVEEVPDTKEIFNIKEVSLSDISRDYFEPSTLKEVSLEQVPDKFKEGGKLNKEDYSYTIDYAKSKNLNWVKRWLDPNRNTIPDWENEKKVATHKLAYGDAEFNGKLKFFVYPLVLEINGELFDFTDPKNKKTEEDAIESAIDNKELLFFDSKEAAEWFTHHYKDYAPKFKEGGKLEEEKLETPELEKPELENLFTTFVSTLPDNQKKSDEYDLKRYWELNDKPKDFEEAIQKGMFNLEDDGLYHANTVQYNPETDEYEFMKSSKHPTLQYELDWYENGLVHNPDGSITELKPGIDGYDEWQDFVKNFELLKSNPYYKYVRRATKSYKGGGRFNVIPDGALHARLHHMENAEDLTKKGIPVVSETEDGKLEQQAEIERDEIIFRISVTEKLEELRKEYENGSLKAAIEAGKLLVKEILYNTLDNTNLINNTI